MGVRTKRLVVAISPKVYASLERIADRYGLAVSTLAAYALGSFAHQQDVMGPYLDDLLRSIAKKVEETAGEVTRRTLEEGGEE